MKRSNVLGVLIGSVVVHAAVTACSSSKANLAGLGDAGDVADALLERLEEPEARAGTPTITAVDEDCSIVETGQRFAKHDFPGKTADQLASVSVLRHLGTAIPWVGGGWAQYGSKDFYVRDGAVLVDCGSSSNPATYDRVRFVLQE